MIPAAEVAGSAVLEAHLGAALMAEAAGRLRPVRIAPPAPVPQRCKAPAPLPPSAPLRRTRASKQDVRRAAHADCIARGRSLDEWCAAVGVDSTKTGRMALRRLGLAPLPTASALTGRGHRREAVRRRAMGWTAERIGRVFGWDRSSVSRAIALARHEAAAGLWR